jgi:hypothetical protein
MHGPDLKAFRDCLKIKTRIQIRIDLRNNIRFVKKSRIGINNFVYLRYLVY